MRIAYITAGAAGMYCGSCMRDNALAAALMRDGHEVTLVPLHTPIKTDTPDVSTRRVFFGGINHKIGWRCLAGSLSLNTKASYGDNHAGTNLRGRGTEVTRNHPIIY